MVRHVALVLLTFVVLMHLALWPALRFVLMKTLYAAQRHDLINQKTTLRTIGLGLVVGAMTPTDFMTKIIEALR